MLQDSDFSILTRPLSKEAIDKVFEEAKEQADYYVGLYRAVIPDWDRVDHLEDYPRVSRATSDYIWQKAIDFDKRVHPDVLAGGLWMQIGFSTYRSHGDPDPVDWTVVYPDTLVIYKEESSETAE